MKQVSRGEPAGDSIGRRALMRGLAVSALPLLAGCAEVTDNDFVATPVYLPLDDASSLGYRELMRDTIQSVERHRATGVPLTTTLTSHFAVYEELVEADGDDGRAVAQLVSALSTPKARVFGGERNSLATLSAQRFLYLDQSLPFREQAGLGDIDHAWNRNSTRLLTEQTELFGTAARVVSRAGIVDPDGSPSVLYVHYVKIEFESDVLFLFASRQWAVDDPDRPVLSDDGYLSEHDLAADILAAKTALNAFTFDG